MPSTGNDDSTTTREDNEFCATLVEAVPALASLWDEHMNDQFEEPLPYVFLADVAGWAEANVVEDEVSVRSILSVLNEGLDEGEGDVPNLIAVGFVEALPGATPLLPLASGSLKAWMDFQFGISSVQPLLRGR
ncbi:DUF7674 family protein [Leucobacter insecticola]|uniref:DUF7674 family protein n=1 Tax=Leucobacter insecticola TaxID=2714934 RepID=UPI003CC70A06